MWSGAACTQSTFSLLSSSIGGSCDGILRDRRCQARVRSKLRLNIPFDAALAALRSDDHENQQPSNEGDEQKSGVDGKPQISGDLTESWSNQTSPSSPQRKAPRKLEDLPPRKRKPKAVQVVPVMPDPVVVPKSQPTISSEVAQALRFLLGKEDEGAHGVSSVASSRQGSKEKRGSREAGLSPGNTRPTCFHALLDPGAGAARVQLGATLRAWLNVLGVCRESTKLGFLPRCPGGPGCEPSPSAFEAVH